MLVSSSLLIFAGAAMASTNTTASRAPIVPHATPPLDFVPTGTATLVKQFHATYQSGATMIAIATDGTDQSTDGFFSSDGGFSNSQMNHHDVNGALINYVSYALDCRSVNYNSAAGVWFVKSYSNTWNRVDPLTGAVTPIGRWFAFNQSSPALTFNGQYILEHENGTIRIMRANNGRLLRTLTGFQYGAYPWGEAVAVDGNRHFLTWDGPTIYVQDPNSNVIDTISLTQGTEGGFTLDWANGLLWTSNTTFGDNGDWFGYSITVGAAAIKLTSAPRTSGGRGELPYGVDVWSRTGKDQTVQVWSTLVTEDGTEIAGPTRTVTLGASGVQAITGSFPIVGELAPGTYELLVSVGTGREGKIYNTVSQDVVVGTPKVERPVVASAPAVLDLRARSYRGGAAVNFSLATGGLAEVSVYDATGRFVDRIAYGQFPAGPRFTEWSGRNAAGRPVTPGMYFVRLTTPDGTRTARLVYMGS
jgi:hypothetical protein